MSVTIEPTVTPAPKPEWPEITAHISKDKWGDIFPCTCAPEEMLESELIYLATFVIPSSADCERKAAALAELERASDELDKSIGFGGVTLSMGPVNAWLMARRKVRDLLGEGRGK